MEISSEIIEWLLGGDVSIAYQRTGEPMNRKMTMLSFPPRWRYDILRALDYFLFANRPYDPRMEDALKIIKTRRRKNSTWPLQARHPGRVHFATFMLLAVAIQYLRSLHQTRTLHFYDHFRSAPMLRSIIQAPG